MYSGLDLFLMWSDILGVMETFNCPKKDHAKDFLEEFVAELREARDDKFSTRQPLIDKLSAVFENRL